MGRPDTLVLGIPHLQLHLPPSDPADHSKGHLVQVPCSSILLTACESTLLEFNHRFNQASTLSLDPLLLQGLGTLED